MPLINRGINVKMNRNNFQVGYNKTIKLEDYPTIINSFYTSKDDYKNQLKKQVETLNQLQQRHYASNHYALLLIFQGIDSSGKDGTIKHVLSGLNPQGYDVYSFKQPSSEALQHDFLWRTTCHLPERGRIAIFNRSYYEEVLVVRVHPALLEKEGVVEYDEKTLWDERYDSIINFEKHLYRNNTRIIKFFLHISKDEQLKRFRSRLDSPEKYWKFSLLDIQERAYWSEYKHAFEACINSTSTDKVPWYIIPADDKQNARLIVSQIIIDIMSDLKMAYPKGFTTSKQALELMRNALDK